MQTPILARKLAQRIVSIKQKCRPWFWQNKKVQFLARVELWFEAQSENIAKRTPSDIAKDMRTALGSLNECYRAIQKTNNLEKRYQLTLQLINHTWLFPQKFNARFLDNSVVNILETETLSEKVPAKIWRLYFNLEARTSLKNKIIAYLTSQIIELKNHSHSTLKTTLRELVSIPDNQLSWPTLFHMLCKTMHHDLPASAAHVLKAFNKHYKELKQRRLLKCMEDISLKIEERGVWFRVKEMGGLQRHQLCLIVLADRLPILPSDRNQLRAQKNFNRAAALAKKLLKQFSIYPDDISNLESAAQFLLNEKKLHPNARKIRDNKNQLRELMLHKMQCAIYQYRITQLNAKTTSIDLIIIAFADILLEKFFPDQEGTLLKLRKEIIFSERAASAKAILAKFNIQVNSLRTLEQAINIIMEKTGAYQENTFARVTTYLTQASATLPSRPSVSPVSTSMLSMDIPPKSLADKTRIERPHPITRDDWESKATFTPQRLSA